MECFDKKLMDCNLVMLFSFLQVDNFIHADMHPGNILVRVAQNKSPQNRLMKSKPHVIFLDVGMTAELSKNDQVNLLEFFKAVALRDGRTAAECTLQFSKQQSCPNPLAFVNVSRLFTLGDNEILACYYLEVNICLSHSSTCISCFSCICWMLSPCLMPFEFLLMALYFLSFFFIFPLWGEGLDDLTVET